MGWLSSVYAPRLWRNQKSNEKKRLQQQQQQAPPLDSVPGEKSSTGDPVTESYGEVRHPTQVSRVKLLRVAES